MVYVSSANVQPNRRNIWSSLYLQIASSNAVMVTEYLSTLRRGKMRLPFGTEVGDALRPKQPYGSRVSN